MNRRLAALSPLLLLLLASAPAAAGRKPAGIQWKKDIRAALQESEDRGAVLFIYITRDD